MGEVVELGCDTTLEVPPDKVLAAALGKLTSVVILGYDDAGDEYFAASADDRAELLWLAERFKRMLIEAGSE